MFIKTLESLQGGSTVAELDEEIKKLIQVCEQTGKVGTLQLSIKIKPRGQTGQVEILDDIKSTPPKFERGVTIMFSTPEGNLMREDPRQSKLDLKVLPKEKKEVIQLKEAQG